MPDIEFVHLHCHSEYSVKSSLIRIPKLAQQVKALGMKSVALTDEVNLFAAVKLYQQATALGIKPIFAAKMLIKTDEQKSSVLLLCQNHQGYLNLSELISLAYLQGQSIDGASITPEQLVDYQQGLIMISLPICGDVAQYLLSSNIIEAQQKAKFWQSIFTNRFYLGGQRTERDGDEQHLHLCLKLGLELNIPLVAVNDVQFLAEHDFETHEARICIAQGGLLDDARRGKYYSNQQYLKSAEEMAALFADLPELLTNSVEIAKRCNVHFELHKKNHLPNFPIPKGLDGAQFLTKAAETGLTKRLKGLNLDNKIYADRLNFELSVIIKMNFPGYFLIVSDFIQWAKDNDIPVGPGRGSGAGSLVAYVLGITNVDPIKHDLLFERFLNPERISMPDFDIDFCTDRRDEVIQYVSKKYGSEKVSQIITYGKMAAKGVVRDVGRVLGHPYGFSDKLSRLIPNELNITLSRALGNFDKNDTQEDKDKWFSAELKARYDAEESVTNLIDLSLELEGLVRNVGTHAGGVLISPSKISDFCPIYKGDKTADVIVSQFDMKDIEAIGLVKFDFLGLSNLTVIDKTLKTIRRKGLSAEPIDLDNLKLDDKAVYQLLQQGDTTGIFQLESDGMRAYLKKLQADCFEDIVAILALYRPGPLGAGMVDNYINVKHGEAIKYPHPILKDILKPTNGVFLYQEQVMKSAQVMGGYSLAEADLLRRAMSKKIPKEMRKQRGIFIKGAKKKGIDETKANAIFDLIDKFSSYGFNKSHSVAYAYILYQTAWLKAHYPAAFMASVLTEMMNDTDRIAFTVNKVLQMGLAINAPNVCVSDYEFSINDDKTLIYGLGAIKGVGRAIVDILVNERNHNGIYKDLFDFCLRIEKRALNSRALDALTYSGAFDVFEVDRASLVKTYPAAVRQAEQRQNDHSSGQHGLFTDGATHTEYEAHYLSAAPFSFKQKLQLEKSVLGYYFYHHPTDEFKADLGLLNATLPKDIIFRKNKEARIVALISTVYYRNTKNGKQMVNMLLEDGSKQLSAVIFNKTLASVSDKLILDEVVLVCGKLNKDFRDQWQIIIDKIDFIEQVKAQYAKSIEITLNPQHQPLFAQLSTVLQQHPGKCPVKLCYQTDKIEGLVSLSPNYAVFPDQKLIQAVDNLFEKRLSKLNF